MLEISDFIGDYRSKKFYYVCNHTVYTIKIRGFNYSDGKIRSVDIADYISKEDNWSGVTYKFSRSSSSADYPLTHMFSDYKEAEDLLKKEVVTGLHESLQEWHEICEKTRIDGGITGTVWDVIRQCAWLLKLNEKENGNDNNSSHA